MGVAMLVPAMGPISQLSPSGFACIQRRGDSEKAPGAGLGPGRLMKRGVVAKICVSCVTCTSLVGRVRLDLVFNGSYGGGGMERSRGLLLKRFTNCRCVNNLVLISTLNLFIRSCCACVKSLVTPVQTMRSAHTIYRKSNINPLIEIYKEGTGTPFVRFSARYAQTHVSPQTAEEYKYFVRATSHRSGK